MAAAGNLEAPGSGLHTAEEDQRKTAVAHYYLRKVVAVVDTAVVEIPETVVEDSLEVGYMSAEEDILGAGIARMEGHCVEDNLLVVVDTT